MSINLIALGSSVHQSKCRCHSESHSDGGKLNKKFLEIVAVREFTTVEDITEVMDWFRRLIKPTETELKTALLDLSMSARRLAREQLTEAGVL